MKRSSLTEGETVRNKYPDRKVGIFIVNEYPWEVEERRADYCGLIGDRVDGGQIKLTGVLGLDARDLADVCMGVIAEIQGAIRGKIESVAVTRREREE